MTIPISPVAPPRSADSASYYTAQAGPEILDPDSRIDPVAGPSRQEVSDRFARLFDHINTQQMMLDQNPLLGAFLRDERTRNDELWKRLRELHTSSAAFVLIVAKEI